MNSSFLKTFADIQRRYGMRAAILRTVRAVLRPLYNSQVDNVYILPDFEGYGFEDPAITTLTDKHISDAAELGFIDDAHKQLLHGFIEEGSRGVGALIDDTLAGYAWVQFGGEYNFGKAGKLIVDQDFAVIKNLLVFPQFRRRGLGRKLNAARLALIPETKMPVVFIIPENRYAIRNWEKFGAQHMLTVKQWHWFSKRWKLSTKAFNNPTIAQRLEENMWPKTADDRHVTE